MIGFSNTFAHRWCRAVESVPDRPFLIFEASNGKVTEFTYAGTDRLVDSVAAGMEDRGVGRGSVVHIVQTNSVGFVATWLACAKLAATIVPSDPRASAAELAEHAARTRPAVAVCLPDRLDEYQRALAEATVSTQVVGVDPSDVDLSTLQGTATEGNHPFRAEVRPTDRLAVMFTSGTTSAPKGVELTQQNYAFTADVMAAAASLTKHDRQLVVLPLFHANAQFYSIAAAIAVGASVSLMYRFSASRFIEQARRHAATHASLFAAPMRMILDQTPESTEPLNLQHTWFAQNLSTAHYDGISTLLGCRPRQLYGMTETCPAVLTNPAIGGRERSIGIPTLGCHVRVVEPNGRPVRPETVGAIQVGGVPGETIFRGYLDDPETTSRSVAERGADGLVWFETGDRATVDEEGFHYFDGRRSDVLKVGGENVSIVEVEQVLAEHYAVADVAVVGVADEMLDEVPVAFVVAGDPQPANVDDELRVWAERHLAPSKRPREYRIVEQLPRTSVGKVRKFLLDTKADSQPRHI